MRPGNGNSPASADSPIWEGASVDDRTCDRCKKTYTPTRTWQRWCSPQCSGNYRQHAYRQRRRPVGTPRPCRYCSNEFVSADGRQYYCSDECSRTAKSLRQAFRLYGITIQQYRAILLCQNGVCAICEQPERTERNRLLTVDHDHVTGQVRGLLCSHCNRAIGLLRDDPEVIERAALYVKENRQMKLEIT